MDGLYDLFEAYEDLGWDESTMAILLARFVVEEKLTDKLHAFLDPIAEEERAFSEEEEDNTYEDVGNVEGLE